MLGAARSLWPLSEASHRMLSTCASRVVRAAWLERPDLPDNLVLERARRESNRALRLRMYANVRPGLLPPPKDVWELTGWVLSGCADPSDVGLLLDGLASGVPDGLIDAAASSASCRTLPAEVLERLVPAAGTAEQLCQLASMCPAGAASRLAVALLPAVLSLDAPGTDQSLAFCYLPVTSEDLCEVVALVSSSPLTGKADTVLALQDPLHIFEQLLVGRVGPGSSAEVKLAVTSLHRADGSAVQLAQKVASRFERDAGGVALALARNMHLPAGARSRVLASCTDAGLEVLLADVRRNGQIVRSVEGEMHARGMNVVEPMLDAVVLEQRLVETLSLRDGHRVIERLSSLPEEVAEVAFGLLDSWEATFGEMLDTSYALVY